MSDPTPVCPECRAGKHVNCTGEAWDDELDHVGVYTCPDDVARGIRHG